MSRSGRTHGTPNDDGPDARTSGIPGTLDVRDLTGPVGAAVLRGVSVAVPPGGTHVVLGAIHSGKSLLLRLILGLQRADRGTVTIDGESFDAARATEDELKRARRRAGVVFASSALVSRLSLLENVELPLVEHTDLEAPAVRDAAAAMLVEVGVTCDVDRTPDTVSRLDRRRAAVARALVLKPRVVLVDEPGNGLDSHAAADLDGTLDALQRRYGHASLICTQEVRYAFRSPHAISVLDEGVIVETGDLERLRNSRHAAVRRLVDRRGAA